MAGLSREERRRREFDAIVAAEVERRMASHDRSLEQAVAVLVTKMDSMEKKFSQLQSAIVRTLTFQFQLLDDPDAKEHAKAIVRDYKFNQSGHDVYKKDGH